MRKYLIVSMLVLLVTTACSNQSFAQSETTSTEHADDSLIDKDAVKILIKNPSTWIQANINKLNSSAYIHPPHLDTVKILTKLKSINSINTLIVRTLHLHSQSLLIRQANDLKNELGSEIAELSRLQKKVVQYNNYLLRETSNILSIEKEIKYFKSFADSTIISIYKPEIDLLDSTLKQNTEHFRHRLLMLVRIEDSINKTGLELQATNRYAESILRQIEANMDKATLPPIWKSGISDYPYPFWLTIKETALQTYESVEFFLKHYITQLILYRVLLFIIALLPVHYFRKNKKQKLTGVHTQRYLQKYPTLASIIMGLAVAPLIFSHAPYAFLDMIFISLTICVSIIYMKEHDYISKTPFYILLVALVVLTLLNFFTSPTFAGRIIYSLSILLVIPMYMIYRDLVEFAAEKQKVGRIIYILLLVQLSFGWALILLGYYPQGRQLFLGAINAFVLALILSVTVYTFIDYLRIVTFMVNKRSKTFQIDHEIIEKSIKNILVGLATLFFIISYLKNINIFDDISLWLNNWVNESRQLGDSTFTYKSVLLFLGFIAGGIFIANLINSSIDTDDSKKHYKKRSALGSIVLLVRFAIITIGFIIGIIASGIPLTQLTVLMGALGVGIGFGLQTIFNNVVSGLILAIEKPVSVGDMVEVGQDSGFITGIGIRSSNIQTFDGAEVIVPNGELISNKLTNWTLSNKRRRMEIKLGVAYKSDPHHVNKLLTNILDSHPEIMKIPEPSIFFSDFGSSSLDFSIYFWISDFVEGRRIRSEVLYRIFDVLKENNIEIPFPQHDLHLRTVESDFVINSNQTGDQKQS